MGVAVGVAHAPQEVVRPHSVSGGWSLSVWSYAPLNLKDFHRWGLRRTRPFKMATEFEGLKSREDNAHLRSNLVGGSLGTRPLDTPTQGATTPTNLGILGCHCKHVHTSCDGCGRLGTGRGRLTTKICETTPTRRWVETSCGKLWHAKDERN